MILYFEPFICPWFDRIIIWFINRISHFVDRNFRGRRPNRAHKKYYNSEKNNKHSFYLFHDLSILSSIIARFFLLQLSAYLL